MWNDYCNIDDNKKITFLNPKEIPHQPQIHHHDEKSALKYLKVSKVILPSIIGLGVVFWLMSKQLDINELSKLQNNGHTVFWVFIAIVMYFMRHMFYSWRLRVITDYAFSWWKSMQLIVIWEFSTAVSPTSVGGAGVAFFLLAKEKLPGAKTITAVLYSMVIDTIFLVMALILLYIAIGPVMIRPGMEKFSDIDGFGITFLTVLTFMFTYGSIFFYGLFINPRAIKRLLLLVSKFPLLKRFREELRNTAYDIVTSAVKIKEKPVSFHVKAFTATAGAWTVRFIAINCLILAFVSGFSPQLYDHFIVFSRGMAMHTIEAFSPTPGASGVAEYLFGGFFSDYIPKGISSLIALVWRLIGYYSYLIAGVIIIPIWFRQVSLKNQFNKASE
ncbi:MAG: hypothetical protein RIR48_1831 [Bacteroidota bacterium]